MIFLPLNLLNCSGQKIFLLQSKSVALALYCLFGMSALCKGLKAGWEMSVKVDAQYTESRLAKPPLL